MYYYFHVSDRNMAGNRSIATCVWVKDSETVFF